MRKINDYVNNSGIFMADSGSIDAFSRLRVSNPVSLFDSQFTYDLQPLLFEKIINGSANISYDSTNGAASLDLDNASNGDSAVFQSYSHIRYQPSKSQLVFLSFNFGGGEDDCIKSVGLSSGSDGFELRMNNGNLEFVILSTTENGNQVIPQSEWNLEKFDGSQKSVELDFEKTQILIIDFQALYVGRVCFGFDVDGVIEYAHEFNNANNTIYPYIRTANLPIRSSITSTSNNVTAEMLSICCAVVSEGGIDQNLGYEFVHSTDVISLGNNVRTHVLSIQPKQLFNGVVNRTQILLRSIDLIVTGGNSIEWDLSIGQSLTNINAQDVNTNYSGSSYLSGDISGDPAIKISNGYSIASGNIRTSINRDITTRYPITLNGVGDVREMGRVTLAAKGIGGTSAVKASLGWTEVR